MKQLSIFDYMEPVPSKWVSVKDRLPEEDGQYLVTILNREWVGKEIVQGAKPPADEHWKCCRKMYAQLPDGRWVVREQRVFQRPNIWSGYDDKVLAWMPLPDPYEGGEQDG